MKDKKTIGFDILDNAGLNEIDKIGTDIDMLDEKTKKRILEMTRKRYNDAIKGENTGIYDNEEDVVDNVEVYSRKKSSKIIMSVVNTAAVLGLAVGSVFLIKNLGRGDNNPDTPLIPPDSTSVGTTGTDIETAAVNALDYLVATDEFIYSLDYAQIDMNGDNVPELIAHLHYNPYSKVCIFHYADGKYNFVEQLIHCSDDPVICLDEKRIYTFDYVCDYDFYYQSYSTWDDELNFTEGDKLERVWGLNENNTCSYLLNDEIISEDEYKNKSENFVTGTKADVEFKNFYNRYSYMDEVGMTDEERIIRESIFEVIDYRNDPSYTKTFNANEDVYKIRYGFIDLNGDSVDEMIILEDFIGASYINIAYLNGNVYSSIMMGNSEEIRYDAENHKLYSILDDVDGYKTIIVEHLEGYDFLEYDSGESNIPHDWYAVSPTDDGGYMYICNNEPCAREEYEAALAEYEACPEFKVDYTTYSVKYLSENPVQNQSVGLTQEETARNKRIEDYIQFLYEYHRDEGENFYESIKIDYAYLDINNDSIDELFIRYNLYDNPEFGAIDCNYFDGTEYIPFKEFGIDNDWKLDLQNRKYYTMRQEKNEVNDHCVLFISTWENVEISHESEYFTLQDIYYSGIDPFIDGTGENVYLRNNEPCTKEEYDKVMAEYENCVGAELNFMPYTEKKSSGDEVQTSNNEETLQTTPDTASEPVSLETLEEAKNRLLATMDREYWVATVKYSFLEMTGDEIPELIVESSIDNYKHIEFYKYDGNEYTYTFDAYATPEYKINLSENILAVKYQLNEDSNEWYYYYKWDNNFNFTINDDFDCYKTVNNEKKPYYIYSHNSNDITESEFNKLLSGFNEFEGNVINYRIYFDDTPDMNEKDIALRSVFIDYPQSGYVTLSYAYADLNSDGESDLIITGKDYDTVLPWLYIYCFENGRYVYRSSASYPSYKIDLENKKIYNVDDINGTVTTIYVETWDEQCNMISMGHISFDEEGFEELLAEYEACKNATLEYHKCW